MERGGKRKWRRQTTGKNARARVRRCRPCAAAVQALRAGPGLGNKPVVGAPPSASALGVTAEAFRPLPWLPFPFQIFLSHFTREEQQILFCNGNWMKNKNNSSSVHLDGSAVKAGLPVLAVPPRRDPAAPAPGSARPRRGTPSRRDARSRRVSWEQSRRGRGSARPRLSGAVCRAERAVRPRRSSARRDTHWTLSAASSVHISHTQ